MPEVTAGKSGKAGKAGRAGRAGGRQERGLRRPLGAVSAGLLTLALGGAVFGLGQGSTTVQAGAARADAARPGSDAVTPTAGAPGATPAGAPGGTTGGTKGGQATAAAPAKAAGTVVGPALLGRSTPLAVAIPSVRLSAPLLGLGMDGKGAAELPPFSLPRTAGWLRDSASPGEPGTAVLVGHVDTTTGPAVFWNLAAVRPGAEVDVSRLDGRTAVFTVDRVRSYPKTAFPGAEVYGPGPGAQLRVITCGGPFDRARNEYTGNVVLFAHLSAVR